VKRLAQVIIPMTLLLMGCESNVGMDVIVAWEDDSNFTATGDWYLAATVGSYIVDSGVAEDAFDQEAITPDEDVSISFSTSGGGEMYTAFIYLDVDGNGSYNSSTDNITDYTTEWVDKNEDVTFEITPYY